LESSDWVAATPLPNLQLPRQCPILGFAGFARFAPPAERRSGNHVAEAKVWHSPKSLIYRGNMTVGSQIFA